MPRSRFAYIVRQLARYGRICGENGVRITVMKGQQPVDFWPSTDKWCVRGASYKRTGINKLIKYLQAK